MGLIDLFQKTRETSMEMKPQEDEAAKVVTCKGCGAELKAYAYGKNLYVCPHCGRYGRLLARTRIRQIADKDSFEELYANLAPADPIHFPGYAEKTTELAEKVGMPDAVKTGMVSSIPLIRVIAAKLKEYGAKNLVVDPVMVATSGDRLITEDAVSALKELLLPLATVLTPNIPEAEILSGMTIRSAADMEAAARAISEQYGCAVLCKGGHQINDADDLLWRSGTGKWFHGKRIANPNTHGTGCTLSSAIASNLAKGCDLDTSVERAKAYISGCLSAMLDLGHGSGPMDHMFALKGEFVDG